MVTILLKDASFFAHHGTHEEERILGNTFIVNLSCSFKTVDKISQIEQTINYVSVYEMVKRRMAVPTALLETLAEEIVEEIYGSEKRIQYISISIEKKNPPIPGMQGSVAVQYQKGF